MKQINFILSLLILLISSCEKDRAIKPEGQEVIVKIVDGRCASTIMEIQDRKYKYLGERKFNHLGNIYDGVFSAILETDSVLGNRLMMANRSSLIQSGKSFKVLITTKPLYNQAYIVDCSATFTKMPSKEYYVYVLE